MASASSMPQSSLKQNLNISDRYPNLPPSGSFDTICNQNIPNQSFSCVRPSLPSNSPFTKQLALKRSSIESIDEQLKKLLKRKLAYAIKIGNPSESIQFHREQLVQQLIKWILPTVELPDEYNTYYKQDLLKLLSSASKKITQDVPADNTAWIKLLTQWIKKNSEPSREIYKVLAVDGFHGFNLKNLQHYLIYILCKLRKEYKIHVIGVRAMYDFFDENDKTECLLGIDSGCVVFLVLLDLYSSRLKLVDDKILTTIHVARLRAEGFLQQRSEQYPDLKQVDKQFRKTFSKVYLQQFECELGMENGWIEVARELLRNIQITEDENTK